MCSFTRSMRSTTIPNYADDGYDPYHDWELHCHDVEVFIVGEAGKAVLQKCIIIGDDVDRHKGSHGDPFHIWIPFEVQRQFSHNEHKEHRGHRGHAAPQKGDTLAIHLLHP